MRRIPEETIDRIRNQTDIVDIIGHYVQLKKQGRNYIGLCPFHGEKHHLFLFHLRNKFFTALDVEKEAMYFPFNGA
ncbi:DNA primase [Listeria fleischmannii subsp. fleischmannii]|uniref:DNA primase n=1 Tax=Listeria fleischmannii subsp. fleischmannii TaxID=1671902 RepID=A0A2X3HI90_9LIST|nr:DNA primase [Listeria fleischmannii subsp. fleischmannii]